MKERHEWREAVKETTREMLQKFKHTGRCDEKLEKRKKKEGMGEQKGGK